MTDPPPTKSGSVPVAARWLIAIAATGVVASLCWLWWPVDHAHYLSEAKRFLRRGEYEQAELAAQKAFGGEVESTQALLIAAESAVELNKPQRALSYLTRIDKRAPDDSNQKASRLTAMVQHFQTFDLAGAEASYLAALAINPNGVYENAGLARLLALCGRRQEAIPHVLAIVRQGLPTDLLFVLARESGAVNDVTLLKNAHAAHPADPRPLLGLARQAEQRGDLAEAVRLAQQAAQATPVLPAAAAELGRYLLLAERLEELDKWEAALPSNADQFAVAWRVRGDLAERRGDKAAALKAYLQAARIAPESKQVAAQVSRLLYQADQTTDGDLFAEHLNDLNALEALQDRVIFEAAGADFQAYRDLIRAYRDVGRIWEAWGWSNQAINEFPRNRDLHDLRSMLRDRLPRDGSRLVPERLNPANRVKWVGDAWPTSTSADSTMETGESLQAGKISFRNDASDVGLRFRFVNGVSGKTQRRMFEFTGGGIGVIDFDLDTFPDLACTQGHPWEQAPSSAEFRDRLFRNRGGATYEEISDSAGFNGFEFGQGTAVGDVNSDGFPDVYVANIGANRLWLNNGDGTFRDASRGIRQVNNEAWTTSCAIADINGDGWSDIYAVNYLQGSEIFDRVCSAADGTPILCSPTQFDGVQDCLLINDGTGEFTDRTVELLSPAPTGKGLGVLVWDAEGDGRLSVFVANDTTQNHFLTASENDTDTLQDEAFSSGLAANRDGKYEGCMGIALGDVNADGSQDLFVTNFLAESNTLYRALGTAIFEDQTKQFRLDDSSLNTLAFGTQFLDADLNGQLELFIANGHVDDLREQGKPWAMSPQLLQLSGNGFRVTDPKSVGPYFQSEHLGRAVAKLDWNLDGRPDLAVGHLLEDAALLTNTTDSPGNSLAISLRGSTSNRDAVGATVTVTVGDRKLVSQVTAGDGYQCSNQRLLTFGCGTADAVEELVVRWPLGKRHVFRDINVPARVVLCEQHSNYYAVP